MRARLTRKLKSERGASILLVLLLFLICMMVGASVLMAAVSNAGKARSNRQEQQAYLALSSALQLVTDDITASEYHGQYVYSVTEESEPGGPEGNKKTIYTYTQMEGAWDSPLKAYLLKDLDTLFSVYLTEKNGEPGSGDETKEYVYMPLYPSPAALPAHQWEIKVEDGAAELEGFTVQIELQVLETYGMELKATLAGVPTEYQNPDQYRSYVMRAELTPSASSQPAVNPSDTEGSCQSSSMTWKLGWITGPEETE